MGLEEAIDLVSQNAALKDRISELTAKQSAIKNELKELITELGEESDKGHIVLDLGCEVSGYRSVMRQKKVTTALDMEAAEKILTDLDLYEDCVTLVPVLDDAKIFQAYLDKKLTEVDFDNMFPAKVSWAIVMSKN
jgi:hypothetical protein